MSEVTQNLKAWADALESGRYEQHFGGLYGPTANAVCVAGCWMKEYSRTGAVEDYIGALIAVGFMGGSRQVERNIAREVERITGRRLRRKTVEGMNDEDQIPFPTFARAIRTVALRMEEMEEGAEIPTEAVTEELVTV